MGCRHLSHHPGGHGGLTHGRPPATHDPVDGARFLVGAVVAADGQHLHVGTLLPQSVQRLFRPLGAARREEALDCQEVAGDGTTAVEL